MTKQELKRLHELKIAIIELKNQAFIQFTTSTTETNWEFWRGRYYAFIEALSLIDSNLE